MTAPRLVFLEYYRGIAALGVASGHYFVSRAGLPAEFFSIVCVEMFFPLSGFVLAPQLLKIYRQRQHFKTFLYRRWLRTMPVYLLGLAVLATLAHAHGVWDILKYALFLNFFSPDYTSNNYFAVSWSLAIEEYYYLVFPAFLFCTKGSLTRKTLLFIGGAFLIKILSALCFEQSFIRIATYTRLDAIALGFAAYALYQKYPARVIKYLRAAVCVLALTFTCASAAHYTWHNAASLLAFLYAASLFFSTCCVAVTHYERQHPPRSSAITKPGLFLGKISYSTYVLHPAILILGHGAISFPAYIAIVVALSALVYKCLEEPILLHRPEYGDTPDAPAVPAQARL
jgi:peptidoglycan/LPS O-acetylase OafA/YrhL